MFFLCFRHFWTYIIDVEAPGIFSGAYFLPKGAIKDVQQSKIPDARDRKRDSRMACSSYVAHDLDDGD